MDFDKNNLLDESFFTQVKALAEEYITFDMFREAFDLSRFLETSSNENSDFRIKAPDFYHEYWKMIIKLKWVGLPIMREEAIIDLFQDNFTKIFGIENYDVWEKLKTVLIAIIVLEDRDSLKASIKNALMNNKERLTKNQITISNEEKEPTVGNWLTDYNSNLGQGAVDRLKLSQYMINGENIKKLDAGEKNKVKVLFKLFEKLKLSSRTLEGVEEEIPIDEDYGHGWIVNGVPQPYKPSDEEEKLFDIASRVLAERDGLIKSSPVSPDLQNLKQMLDQYPVGSIERRAVEEEIKNLGVKS